MWQVDLKSYAQATTRFSFSGLRARLLFLVLLVIIPSFGLIVYMAWEQRLQEASAAGEKTLKSAREVVSQQRRHINQTRDFLTKLAQHRGLDYPNFEVCPDLLAEKLKERPEYANIFLLTLDGDVVCSAVPLEGQRVNASDRAYFQQTVASNSFSVGEYQIGRVTGKATLAFGFPVLSDSGKLTAVLAASLDLSNFGEPSKNAGLPEGSTIVLIDRKGTILMRQPDPQSFVGKSLADHSLVRRLLAAKGEEVGQAEGLDGVHRLYAFVPLRVAGDASAYLGVGISSEVAFADANRTLRHNLIFLGLVSLVAFSAAWFGGDLFILRRVKDLVNATKKLAAGDLSARTALPYGNSELTQLARAFDGMAELLQRRQFEVEQAQEDLKARLAEGQALNKISQAVLASLDVPSLCEQILDQCLSIVSMDMGVIRLLDPSDRTLKVVASRGYRNPENINVLASNPASPAAGRVLREVLASNGAFVVESVLEAPGLRTFKKESVQSAVAVPVRVRDEVLGTIQLGSRKQRKFATAEIQLFEAIGNQVGVAIQKARLFEAVNRNLRRIRALHDIDVAITSTLNLKTILQVLLEKIDLFIPYPSATTVRLLNKENDQLEPFACRNIDEEQWKRQFAAIPNGRSARVLKAKKPFTVRNVQTDPLTPNPSLYRSHGLISSIGVPLIVKGEALGVLNLYTKEEHDFSDEEVEFLVTLAGQAAIAIHNGQMYAEVQMRERELERANKIKDEFLSIVSHELRTPLNVIMGYTGLLAEGMFGELSARQSNALHTVTSQSKDLLSIVSEILQATQLGRGETPVTRTVVNLAEFLDELNTAYDLPTKRALTVHWDYPSDLPTVETDSDKLRHIIQNLINNAIKFTEKGRVIVSARVIEGRRQGAESEELGAMRSAPSPLSFIEFKVADTGVGISQESLPIIFDKFRQADSSGTRPYGGVGLGLYIVKKYTELLGGAVEVESEPGRGSTFTITIPFQNQRNAMFQERPLEQTL